MVPRDLAGSRDKQDQRFGCRRFYSPWTPLAFTSYFRILSSKSGNTIVLGTARKDQQEELVDTRDKPTPTETRVSFLEESTQARILDSRIGTSGREQLEDNGACAARKTGAHRVVG